jgi:O-antigen ligase
MTAVRLGICLLVAFSVFAHGAVEVWSESTFEIGAAALFLLWGILVSTKPRAELRWSALNWPFLGILGLGLAQLSLRVTNDPYLTRAELLRVLAYFLLFFLTAQVFRDKAELRGLVWFLVALGFAVGLFAMIQYFTWNGKLYWFRELTAGGSPFGPYVNRNHFAGFVELIAPLGLALIVLRGARRELAPLAGLLTIVPVAALFTCGSRGGIIVFIFELGLLALVMRMHRAGNVRVGTAAVVLLAAGAMIAWVGVGTVTERFSQPQTGEVTLSGRTAMLRDAARIFQDHPWMGTGLGTLVEVYPRYASFYDGKIVDHAHDDYVEALAEGGVPAALCGLAFLFLLFRSSWTAIKSNQSPFSLSFHAGALVACGGLLLHSLVDFNLHIPSNAILFVLSGYLASSPPLVQDDIHRGVRRTSRTPAIEAARPVA